MVALQQAILATRKCFSIIAEAVSQPDISGRSSGCKQSSFVGQKALPSQTLRCKAPTNSGRLNYSGEVVCTAAPPRQAHSSLRDNLRLLDQNDAQIKCQIPQNLSKTVIAIILGGGNKPWAEPLTRDRAGPAIPVGANYRLVDIPISNCINSDINNVNVLTQYNSLSLNSHIASAFPPAAFGTFGGSGLVQILPAQQMATGSDWYKGSADAVRCHLSHFMDDVPSMQCEEYLVLSGDQMYRMNYGTLIGCHREAGNDITIACVPVEKERAHLFGLMDIDHEGRVLRFFEKPSDAMVSAELHPNEAWGSKEKPYVASMGNYVFKRELLLKLLIDYPEDMHFGKDLIRRALSIGARVGTFRFDGYWNEISSLRSYLRANLDQATNDPAPFDFHDPKAPIYTQALHLPPSFLYDCQVSRSLIGEGCYVENGAKISGSVLGHGTVVSQNVTIEDSLVLGLDSMYSISHKRESEGKGEVPLGIGEGSYIKNAIIDKNARIGKNVRITNDKKIQHLNRKKDGYMICEGIVVIMKKAVIPDGCRI
eukprot:jgi/Mesvir1/11287/Mv01081-RA.1